MLPTKEGTFLATVKSAGVEQKDKGTVFANIEFDLKHLVLADGVEDVNGQYITGYFNLVKADGTLNEISIRSIRESIGWAGGFSDLQNGAFAGVEVQVVLAMEDYNGKSSMRVKYLNPKDYAGGNGLKKSDASTLQSLDAKFGAMLRATGGGSGPAKMPAGAAAKKAAAVPSGAPLGKDMAWKAFTKKVDEHNAGNPSDLYTEERRAEVFKKVVLESATPKKPSEMSQTDWANVVHDIEEKFSPAIGELLPF